MDSFISTRGDGFFVWTPTGESTSGSVLPVGGNFDVIGNVSMGDILSITPSATPGSASAGDVYYDSTSNKHRGYNVTIWNDMS